MNATLPKTALNVLHNAPTVISVVVFAYAQTLQGSKAISLQTMNENLGTNPSDRAKGGGNGEE